MAHLRHRRHRFRLRHLRNPDAAAHRQAGAAGTDGRRAGIAGVSDVGRPAVLHPGVCRRHLRAHRRISHRPARPPARADLQHPHLRDRGVSLGILDLDRDAARAALLRVHRRVRRVRRRRSVARRALPRGQAAREGARLHAGVFVARRHHGRDGQRAVRRVCREPAVAEHVRPRPVRSARAVALHADVGRAAGDPADPDPPVPARVTCLAAKESRRHAAAGRASPRCSLRIFAARRS